NVREIVDEVIKDKKLAVDEKGLRFFFKAEDGDVSYMVRGDITKMKQVVNNIVDNAIKYTSKGLIRVLLSKDEATNKVRISVSDTGMGMDKETIEHIFKMFNKQGGSSKETLPVSGIGLYVARQIMKAHRGRIWAGSGGVGQGTTFFIEMNGATGIEEVNKDNIQQFKAI
ncbi:MAG TPA: HAMP domain-containing histidine kinase, partial [Candidatus Yonathbacteria bacterium]|nr:HAMP domain-containing histidine kinase [Candidatus Yonathbacteria bacterium]